MPSGPEQRGRILFVGGTDTGVGKTLVGAGLALALRREGRRVLAVKPVESGCRGARGAAGGSETADGGGSAGSGGEDRDGGGADGRRPAGRDEDGAILARATGQAAPCRALLRLRAPVAPPLAADLEGRSVELEPLVTRTLALARDAEICLVEGAGGLMSPLAWNGDNLDLARRLGAEVLLVTADRLGTVNHTRLALAALRSAELPVRGLVLSAPAEADASTGTNAESLSRYDRELPPWLVLPRVAGPEEASEHLAAALAWPGPGCAMLRGGGGGASTGGRPGGGSGPPGATHGLSDR